MTQNVVAKGHGGIFCRSNLAVENDRRRRGSEPEIIAVADFPIQAFEKYLHLVLILSGLVENASVKDDVRFHFFQANL